MRDTNRTTEKDNRYKQVILVTHENPDLDACMAIWLLRRFVFKNKRCQLRFVPMGARLPSSEVTESAVVIYVDTSGGKYDHHQSRNYVCAASLVMKDRQLEQDLAIKRMVKYTLAVDHGRILTVDVADFDVLNAIEGLNELHPEMPELVVDTAGVCFDGIYHSLNQMIQADSEIQRIEVFETRWGRGGALETSNQRTRHLAHRKGVEVFLYVDPRRGYRGFTSPGSSSVDFTSVFKIVKRLEPDVPWFLHSSRQLLLCGSSKASDRKPSSLSLKEMVKIVKAH